MKQQNYDEIRNTLKTGDVIAFGGSSALSIAIKAVTACKVSHVGIILNTQVRSSKEMSIVNVIESTSLGEGFAGVQINRLSTRVYTYTGNIWVLPLAASSRLEFEEDKYTEFMLAQRGKAYDAPQALFSALDGLFPDSREDFTKLFCSELVTAGLEAAKVLGNVNASEQTPADVVRFPIYDEPCQIKGRNTELF